MLFQIYPRKLKSILNQYTHPKKKDKLFFIDNKTGQEIQLKKDFIIDMIHQCKVNYTRDNENYFNISSKIYQNRYGYQYRFYIQFMLDHKIAFLKSGYFTGKKCKSYSINLELLRDRCDIYFNKDKVLIRKEEKYRQENFKKCKDINENVKQLLVNDLAKVSIDHVKSLEYIDKTYKPSDAKYISNTFSIESIKQGSNWVSFDEYGRMHTNFTTLKSEIRKNFLFTTSKLVELDIPNSQPFFFLKIAKNNSHFFKDKFKSEELERFKGLVYSGTLYDSFVTNEISRKKAKLMIYKVFFGKNKNDKSNRYFKSKFPWIHEFICYYKLKRQKSEIIAHELQKLESNFVYNTVIKEIKETIPECTIITIHDSIMTEPEYKDKCNEILEKHLEMFKMKL